MSGALESPKKRADESLSEAHAWSLRDALGVAAILAVALVLRLLHLQALQSNDPFFENPPPLGCLYNQWAIALAEGDWVGDFAFRRGPLYPYFLGIFYRVFGSSPWVAPLNRLA